MRSCPHRGRLAAVAGSLMACGLPDVRYVTDRLEIAPYFDFEVCQGTAIALDAHVRDLEEIMHTRQGRIRFYWGEQGVEEHCVAWAGGCWKPRKGAFFAAKWPTIRHEIVHAVAAPRGQSTAIIEESIAGILSGELGLEADFSFSSEQITVSHDEWLENPRRLDLANGAHFVAFLFERFGTEAVLLLRDRIPDGSTLAEVDAAFVATLGISREDAEAAWRVEAPTHYRARRPPCPLPGVAWQAGVWEREVDLDCSDYTTMGPRFDITPKGLHTVEQGMFRVETVDILRPVRLQAELFGDPSGDVVFSSCDCGYSKVHVNALADPSIELEACRWEVHFRVPHTEPTTLRLRLTEISGG